MNIDTRFIDIDLEQEAIANGYSRGWIEQDAGAMSAATTGVQNFEAVHPLIPRSEWKETAGMLERSLRNCVREILSQGREGSCVANSTIGAFQTRSWFLWGVRGYRRLSAMSLYKRIGRSAQSGAYVPDSVDEMLQRGCLPLNISENNIYNHVHPATGFSKSLPSGWEETGLLFRVVRYLRVNTVDEWFSALARGNPIVYGRKGHAIYSWLPTFDGNALYFGYPNSWGQWGDVVNDVVGKGMGWDSERLIGSCTGYALDLLTYRSELAGTV